MRTSRQGPVPAVVIAAALVGAVGCSPTHRDAAPGEAERGSTAGGAVAAPEQLQVPTPAEVPAAPAPEGPSTKPTPPPRPADEVQVPDAIRELQDKIQPPGSSPATVRPPQAPPPEAKPPALPLPEAELLEKAASAARRLADALRTGDRAEAGKVLISKEDFETWVRPGFRDQIAGHILSANDGLLRSLVDQLRDKAVHEEWKPGTLGMTPQEGFFTQAVASLGASDLNLTVDGVPLKIRVDQMVFLDGTWKVLRFTAP